MQAVKKQMYLQMSPYVIPGIKRQYLPEFSNNNDNYQFIIDRVISYFNVDKKKIFSKGRKREYVYPRQCIAYLLKKHTSATYLEIGQILGQRDHTTAIHCKMTIENLLFSDEKTQNDIRILTQLI